jgi:hypothetical protein
VDLAGPALAGGADRAAAAAAEAAAHAGRGGEPGRRAVGEADGGGGETGVGRDGGAGRPAAALAVAVGDPVGPAGGLEADGAAAAAARAGALGDAQWTQAPPPQQWPPKLGPPLAQAPSPQAIASPPPSPERLPTAGRARARGAGSVQLGQGWGASLAVIRPQAENSPCSSQV